MSLIIGESLKPERFFSTGKGIVRASGFDLTIGTIFDHDGKKIDGPFRLKLGHMVQVVSAEIFKLPSTVTGHVTYKTSLTRQGIWALTVGIVDPGWEAPIATTLLNFSRVDHAIDAGDAFLRVSFFEHDPVPAAMMAKSPAVSAYLADVKRIAMTRFPPTFLNQQQIAKEAGDKVLKRIRLEGLAWVAVIAAIFTIIQVVLNVSNRPSQPREVVGDQLQQVQQLQNEVRLLGDRIGNLEAHKDSAPVPNAQSKSEAAKQTTPPAKPSPGQAAQP